MNSNNKLTLISVFSGAMGLDQGLEKAGFRTCVATDINKYACETIRTNLPNMPVIEGDINNISSEDLLNAAGLNVGEVMLLAGGSPCQSFSTAGKRKAFEDDRGKLLLRFIELVEEIKPRYFILENVRGILNARLKHRPISERGPEFPPLTEEEKTGSVLKYILNRFNKTGYLVSPPTLLNAADYGVPQTRERVFFIGTLADNNMVQFPEKTHSKLNDDKLPWVTFKEVLKSLDVENHTYNEYARERMRYMRMIPVGGGNWRDLPDTIAKEAMGKAYYSGGGKVGFFRRISLDKPSPTLLTSPLHKSTNLGHPLEDRPLSVEEYKAIQQFPNDWIICGNINEQYKQIGNAVPVGLGYHLGKNIIQHIDSNL